MPRKPQDEGPRKERLPEPKFHTDEANDIREAAGNSVSDFIRRAAVNEARRVLDIPKKRK